MMALSPPETAASEDAKIAALTKKPNWTNQTASWLVAYADYRLKKGNPWEITPVGYADDIAESQRELYESRKNGGPIKRIRYRRGLLCCPVCGSTYTSAVDHYLPKAIFPEYSIMYSNLVTACVHCNSGAKGVSYRGHASPQRFIHPYFDSFQNAAIWKVRVAPPLEAPMFEPTVLASVDPMYHEIVRFHLDGVLGEQFRLDMANQWSAYPDSLVERLPVGVVLDRNYVETRLQDDKIFAVTTMGLNGWRAALYRGMLGNPAIIDFLVMESIRRSML